MRTRKKQVEDGTEAAGPASPRPSVHEPPSDQLLKFLSIDDFARRAGLSVSTVRRLIRAGSIRYEQPGGKRHRIIIPPNPLNSNEQGGPSGPSILAAPAVPVPTAGASGSDTPPGLVKRQVLRGKQPEWTKETFSTR